jgi:type II secretory pathway pseudopilin PulG
MINQKKGFMLVEMLIYLVVMLLITSATVYFVMTTYDLYRSTVRAALSDRVAATILGELVRETRLGLRINYAESDFGVTHGAVTFETIGNSSKSFELTGGQIMYTDGGEAAVPLNPQAVAVTRFLLTSIITPVSEAIRYDIGVTYVLDGVPITRYYQGVALLRQSYD